MPGCLFCKVAAGEIPATIVKRGDGLIAFRDINPQAPTHLLVIPTQHVPSLNDAKDPELLGRMLGFARDLAREMGVAERGYRVVLNTPPPTRRRWKSCDAASSGATRPPSSTPA